MKIRNVDTFYWIANLGSFRAAAERLHLTQPAITARIQVLEQDLGTEVFERDTRRAELTRMGRRLLPWAEKLMELDQAIIDCFSATANVEQTIRLGVSETIVSSWLPDFLTHYEQIRPNLSFDLVVDSTNSLRDLLVAREIDLAFLMGPVAQASIENIDLCGFEMGFAAIPAIANEHQHWRIGDLSQKTILTFSGATRPYRQVRELLSPFADGELKIISSASLGAIVRLGLAGYGICAIPKTIIKQELASGALQMIPIDCDLQPISFTASYVAKSSITRLAVEIANSAQNFLAPRMINFIYQS